MSTARELGERIKDAMHASLMSNKVEAEMGALIDRLVSLAQPGEEALTGWKPIEGHEPKNGEDAWLLVEGKVLRGAWVVIDFKEYRDDDGFYVGQVDPDAYWMNVADGDRVEPTHYQRVVPPEPPGITSTPTGDSNG